MTHGRAEICRWEKLCKNILLIKTLNKLCLTIFYLYILWFYTTQQECLTWKNEQLASLFVFQFLQRMWILLHRLYILAPPPSPIHNNQICASWKSKSKAHQLFGEGISCILPKILSGCCGIACMKLLYPFFLIPWRMLSYWMELRIRIYGFFEKMSPRILCTLTATQNLTWSTCEGKLWTAWGFSEHQYCILAVSIPIHYEPYLFQKLRKVKLWIRKSFGYQCSRSPALQ